MHIHIHTHTRAHFIGRHGGARSQAGDPTGARGPTGARRRHGHY